MPSPEEYRHAWDNLERAGWQVDLVITQVEIAARVGMEILQEDFGMEVPQKVLDTLLAD